MLFKGNVQSKYTENGKKRSMTVQICGRTEKELAERIDRHVERVERKGHTIARIY